MGRNAFQRPRAEAIKLLSDVMKIYKKAKCRGGRRDAPPAPAGREGGGRRRVRATRQRRVAGCVGPDAGLERVGPSHVRPASESTRFRTRG